MKVRRLISVILCIAILLCITLPSHPVNAASIANLDNVVTAGDYAAYTYENSSFTFCLFLDCQSGTGSFAIIEKNDDNYMHEYLFSLETEEINIESLTFWNDLISDCFAHSTQWSTAYIPDTITYTSYTSGTETTATPLASDPHYNYFMNWLTNLNGPARTDYHVSDHLEVHILFSLYETVQYTVSRCNSYVVKEALTAAGFITGFLGILFPTSALINTIGVLTDVTGLLVPNTVVGQYTLSCNHRKYITTQGGNIKYATAVHFFQYDAYTSSSTNAHAVNTESLWEVYDPSEADFDTYTLFRAAYTAYTS